MSEEEKKRAVKKFDVLLKNAKYYRCKECERRSFDYLIDLYHIDKDRNRRK